jgi:phage terminase small subunit
MPRASKIPGRTLTIKQTAFCQEYVRNGGVAIDAYKHAYDTSGMKERTISSRAYEQLQNGLIAGEIQRLTDESAARVAKRTDITKERILAEYAKIGFFDPRKLLDDDGRVKNISELDDDTAGAIGGVEFEERVIQEGGEELEVVSRVKKIKITDKRGALDSMAKHLGMFVERHEHTGKDGAPIEGSDISNSELARRMAFLLAKAAQL